MSRNAVSVILALISVLGACANEMPIDPEDPRFRDARLTIVGAAAVNLGEGEFADLTVRYVNGDGEPIADTALTWATIGEDGGARLGALETITDLDGQASMMITAGDIGVTFDVRVTPPLGDPVTFNVSVSGDPAGSIIVNMTYSGRRTLERFDAVLFDAQSCAMMDPHALPTSLRRATSVTDISARPAFAGLAPGAGYAVAVLAYNATHLAGFGCRDMVAVAAGEDTELNITLMNVAIPPNFAGTWDLDNQLDFGGALPPSVDAFLNVIGELADDDATDALGEPDFELTDLDGDGYAPEYGVDPGAFVIDVSMRQTCHWECLASEEYDTCSEVNHGLGDLALLYTESFQTWDGAQSRFFGGCGSWDFIQADMQSLVNAQVAAVLPDFTGAWAQLAADLSRSITNAHILSVLTISAPGAGNEFEVPISHELERMVVDFRNPMSDPPGAAESRTFLLADAGFMSLVATDVSTVDGTTLLIPEHQFNINWGELTLYIYRQILLREIFGVTSTGELLATWVDCPRLAASLYTSLDDLLWPLSVPVTTAELETYCHTGLAAAGGLLEAELAGLLDAPGVLTLMGSAMGADVSDDTGQVDRLVDGAWSGTFAESMMTGDVTGTFTGLRRGR